MKNVGFLSAVMKKGAYKKDYISHRRDSIEKTYCLFNDTFLDNVLMLCSLVDCLNNNFISFFFNDYTNVSVNYLKLYVSFYANKKSLCSQQKNYTTLYKDFCLKDMFFNLLISDANFETKTSTVLLQRQSRILFSYIPSMCLPILILII